jgi:hypothetical protein
METEKAFYERLERKGVSRRDFMKYCTFLTAAMGLSSCTGTAPTGDMAAFRRMHRLFRGGPQVPIPIYRRFAS